MSIKAKISSVIQNKESSYLSAMTAYDYPSARIIDELGIDFILVGDSLGMVILGHPDTTQVTLDHMCHHISAVRNGVKNAILIGDLPINTYRSPEEAKESALKLKESGADCVKLEGGFDQILQIQSLIKEGIPVMGHIGLLPQSIHQIGGYKKRGENAKSAKKLLEEALLLEETGCFAIVLECIFPEVAREITQMLKIPTIGIGCGEKNCRGEIAVFHDIVGAFPWFIPGFVTPQGNVAKEMKSAISSWKERIEKDSNLP